MNLFSKRKFEKEKFSENCPIEGYKVLDFVTKKFYFWNETYGLIAVIDCDDQSSTLFKTKGDIPDNFHDLMALLLSTEFTAKCSIRHFNTTMELEEFINRFVEALSR